MVGISIAPMRKLRRVPNSIQVIPSVVAIVKTRSPRVPEM